MKPLKLRKSVTKNTLFVIGLEKIQEVLTQLGIFTLKENHNNQEEQQNLSSPAVWTSSCSSFKSTREEKEENYDFIFTVKPLCFHFEIPPCKS